MSYKNLRFLYALGAAMALLYPGQVAAEAYDDALSSLHRGAYESAQEQFMDLSERGHAGAQFELGLMFHRGIGLPQNYRHALKWYRLAAAGGDARARNNLGVMNRDGQGVEQSKVMAYMWFSLAAPADDGTGRDNLERLSYTMSSDEILRSQQLAEDYIAKVKAQIVSKQPVSLSLLNESAAPETVLENPVDTAQEEEVSSIKENDDSSVFNAIEAFFSKMLSNN